MGILVDLFSSMTLYYEPTQVDGFQ